MEAEWIADGATIRSLAREHPDWTQQDRASALGRSVSWIKKWLKRFQDAPPDDLHVLLSRSRAHHTRLAADPSSHCATDCGNARTPA
jgi:hypothetical protein